MDLRTRFQTKAALERHVRALLDGPAAALDPVFWTALARCHPHFAAVSRGAPPRAFRRSAKHASKRSVLMTRADGSETPLSWCKCALGCFSANRKKLAQRLKRARLLQTLRSEVQGQTDRFRGLAVCRDGGNMRYTSTTDWHVGHDYERGQRFIALVHAFLRDEHKEIGTKMQPGEARGCLLDRALARRWQAYHQTHAVLRMERARANLRGNRGFRRRRAPTAAKTTTTPPAAPPAPPPGAAVRLRDGRFAQVLQSALPSGRVEVVLLTADPANPAQWLLGDEPVAAVKRGDVEASAAVADLASLRAHKAAWRAVGLRLARASATGADVFVRADEQGGGAALVDVGDGAASDDEEEEEEEEKNEVDSGRADLHGYHSDGGFVVADDEGEPFSFADPATSEFVAETHAAVGEFEAWEPKGASERKAKKWIAGLAGRVAARDDNRHFARGETLEYSRPPKRQRRARRRVEDDD
jgi:hypothetical protein